MLARSGSETRCMYVSVSVIHYEGGVWRICNLLEVPQMWHHRFRTYLDVSGKGLLELPRLGLAIITGRLANTHTHTHTHREQSLITFSMRFMIQWIYSTWRHTKPITVRNKPEYIKSSWGIDLLYIKLFTQKVTNFWMNWVYKRVFLVLVWWLSSQVSLSKQHTDLLICHCTKQDLSRTSRYLGITYANSQDSYCQCDYIHMN